MYDVDHYFCEIQGGCYFYFCVYFHTMLDLNDNQAILQYNLIGLLFTL